MKIKKLYAENIYSFKKLVLDFLDFAGVISIILGKNLDEKTANGAGKTSILKALYWALWNKDLNGATIDEMINRMNPEAGMLTILEFEDRGYDYKITRYKNYRPHANGPKLHDGTPVSGSGVEFLVNGSPLMGDSHPKTQLIIEQKLRMSPRLFLSCVLMAQNTRTNFLTANDTEKKELLSELLDLQAYEKAFKTIKDAIKEVEDRVALNENRIENLQEQLNHNQSQVVSLVEDEKKYLEETKRALAKMDLEMKAYQKAIADLAGIANQEDQSQGLRQQIAQVENKIKKIKEDLSAEVAVVEALTKLEAELGQKENNFKDTQESIKTKTEQKTDLQKRTTTVVVQNFANPKQLLEQEVKKIKEEVSKTENEQISLEQKYLVQQKSLQVEIKQTQMDLDHARKHLQSAQDNTHCPTCLRTFAPGESASLDQVLQTYHDKIKQLEQALLNKEQELNSVKQQLEALNTLNNQARSLREQLAEKEIDLQTLKNQEQEYLLQQKDKDLWDEQIKILTIELDKLHRQAENLEKNIKVGRKKLQEVEKMKEDFKPLKKQLEKLELSIADQRQELSKSEGVSIKIQQAKREKHEKEQLLKDLINQYKELETKANPFTKMKETFQLQIATFKERLMKHKEVVRESQEELKYLNFWKTGFSPIGIRSFITDDVIELLNRKTQENLNDLFDGAISVLFDPESKNNKGIVSNKISTVFMHHGKETSVSLLSGGELQRAILATELALTEVAEARAGTKLNLRFLDEPFTGMDNNGQIKSLSLFARMARDKDGFFVISHDENFQHLCQKAIFVMKQKEVSYIVDKETFNKAEISDADMAAGYEEGENLQLVNVGKKSKPAGINLDQALKKKKKMLEDEDD